MASRLVENERAQVTAETQLIISSPFLNSSVPGDDNQTGKNFHKFEYEAYVNKGEMIRCVLNDPFFTMINPATGGGEQSYYKESRSKAPVNILTYMGWAGLNKKSPSANHALVGMAPYGNSDNSQLVEFVGIDYASWFLSGGDSSGSSYKGNIQSVVKQVVEKYGRGLLQCDFKSQTNDNKENRWWQNRMTPKTFIMSLLDWSTPLTNDKSRWLVYPDDESGPAKVIISEQSSVVPRLRSKYYWKGKSPSDQGTGDIIRWELKGNNGLQMMRHKVTTSGISSVSGTYYDKTTPDDGQKVKVGDKETSNRLNPKTNEKLSFTKPVDNANPLDSSVGWTSIGSIPEFSGGDLGIKYDDYIDGKARGYYLALDRYLLQCQFTVNGHYIWSGSEGLGVDMIEVVMHTAAGDPHFLKGKWIVYGYKHTMTRKNWTTDLYCYRLDHDSNAKKI